MAQKGKQCFRQPNKIYRNTIDIKLGMRRSFLIWVIVGEDDQEVWGVWWWRRIDWGSSKGKCTYGSNKICWVTLWYAFNVWNLKRVESNYKKSSWAEMFNRRFFGKSLLFGLLGQLFSVRDVHVTSNCSLTTGWHFETTQCCANLSLWHQSKVQQQPQLTLCFDIFVSGKVLNSVTCFENSHLTLQ